MIHAKVVMQIVEDKSYFDVCMNIAGNKENAKELYQDFILAVYNIKEKHLISATEKGYTKWLLIKVLKNLHQTKYNKYINIRNGNYLMANNFIELDNWQDVLNIEQEQQENSETITIFFKDFEKILNRPESSAEMADGLFLKYYLEYGDLRKLSREVGLSYNVCRKRLNYLRKKYANNN